MSRNFQHWYFDLGGEQATEGQSDDEIFVAYQEAVADAVDAKRKERKEGTP